MKRIAQAILGVATLVRSTSALATYSPGPSYAVAIPPSTSSSNSGDIYIQLSASPSYQWAALGIGSEMAGSHMFIIYTDGSGNVTLSPRSARGNFEPDLDPSLEVELLAGSGITDNNMVANVRCANCVQYLDSVTDSDSNWIAAWREGDAIDSSDTGFTLARHDTNKQFTFDLSQAAVAEDSNPFIALASTNATASTNSTSEGASSEESESEGTVARYDKAHGILMGLAVIILFPLGALLMPLLGSRVASPAFYHGAFQLFVLCVFIAAFGLGVRLADLTDQLYNNAHTRFGTAILVLFLLQPIGGAVHHWRWRKQVVSEKRKLATGHKWLGRVTIGLAVINGGLGLELAENTTGGKVAWGVLAGLVALIWAGVAFWRRKKGAGSKNNMGGAEKIAPNEYELK